MNDELLIEWATTVHAESAAALGRRYKISDQRIANWVRLKAFPMSKGVPGGGWRGYFQAQFAKSKEGKAAIAKKAQGMMNSHEQSNPYRGNYGQADMQNMYRGVADKK